jgi:hypothetical protein
MTRRLQVAATEITRSVIVSIINLSNNDITRHRENVITICCVNSVSDSYSLPEILMLNYRNTNAESERV